MQAPLGRDQDIERPPRLGHVIDPERQLADPSCKTGKAQTEHMFSGSPPLADINESRQHFRIVQERL